VDNGQVVTTAGVSAGIDGSLHVVARLLGRHVADRTAEYMEYRWSPEAYLAKGYAVLNPSLDDRGRRLQQADIYSQENNSADAIRVCEQLVKEDSGDADAWFHLGNACHSGKRYDDAVRAYSKAARSNDIRARAWYNAACSAGLMKDNDHALEYLKRAFDAGFAEREQARNDADLAVLRGDPRFEALTAPNAGSRAGTASR
jgi:tetratricopeptide (TPR) repeat protein